MVFRFSLRHRLLAGLTAPALLALGTGPVLGQCLPGCTPGAVSSWVPGANGATPAVPAAAPANVTAAPTTPQAAPKEPGKEPAVSAAPEQSAATPPQNEAEPSQDQSASIGGAEGFGAAPGGYLDNAVPTTMFRLRYDAEFGINRFDRATFQFGAWKELEFHPHAVQGGGAFFDRVARGPNQLPTNVDLQIPSAYGEYAFSNWFSAFVTVPFEYVSLRNLEEDHPEGGTLPNGSNPELKVNGILPQSIQKLTGAARLAAINAAYPNPGGTFFPEPRDENGTQHTTQEGLDDIDFGIKVALIAEDDRYLTLQLRTYTPTGNSAEGIGTGHWTEEPSLLYYQRLGCWELQGQLQAWIPLTNDPVAGDIIDVGVGLGYEIYRSDNVRIVPITEWVMWEVLNGFETVFEHMYATPSANLILPMTHGVESARGTTIVNGKIGVRTYFGDSTDLYVGFGQAVTRERWYDDILRVEFRYKF